MTTRVLVAGGCGFIGSHIVDALLSKGYSVGVLDNLSTGDISNIASHTEGSNGVELHRCDIRDYESVEKVLEGYDAVIHEAALVSVTRSVEDPLSVNAVNVGGTLNLLRAAVKANVSKFVYASSSSVYGESETLPKRETMNTLPVSPYGASKLAAENYCRVFAKVYGLNTISLRYFNVYGPRQKHGQYSGVIPAFIQRVLKDEPPVIYGDGEQTRDFTYVGDVVQANMLCLERDVRKGEALNIAAGRPITVNALAALVLELMGRPDLTPVHLGQRAGDIKHSYADITEAWDRLGYEPRFMIEDGLRLVIDWLLSDRRWRQRAELARS